jgi:alkylhydroperoxidase family enzyme
VLGAYLSRRFGCDFCHLGHLDTVEAIAGPDARGLVESPTPEYAALFRFADSVVANAVTDEAVDDLVRAGFDESAAQDVVFVAALFGFANRMVTGFGIHYRADRDRASSMALAKGYTFRPGN